MPTIVQKNAPSCILGHCCLFVDRACKHGALPGKLVDIYNTCIAAQGGPSLRLCIAACLAPHLTALARMHAHVTAQAYIVWPACMQTA